MPDSAIRRLLALHDTASPRHALCVTCGERFPCQTRELVEALDLSLSVTVDRSITTPVDHARPSHNWSYNSGAVSAPMAEPDAGKSEPTASVLTVPVTSYPSSPESQGA